MYLPKKIKDVPPFEAQLPFVGYPVAKGYSFVSVGIIFHCYTYKTPGGM